MYRNGRQDTPRLKDRNSYKAFACFTYICELQLWHIDGLLLILCHQKHDFFRSECIIKRLVVGFRPNLLRAQLTIDAKLQSTDLIAFRWGPLDGKGIEVKWESGKGEGKDGREAEERDFCKRSLPVDVQYNNMPHIDYNILPGIF